MKVAIVHYWLVGMRGGEKVVEALCELFPQADIFTHVYDPDSVSDIIRARRVTTTFIQRLPRATKWYQRYLPLMPMALEQLDLGGYDLVISSESGPAKGVIVPSECLHVCYCHTPMRYVWDMYHEYYQTTSGPTRWLMPSITHKLRLWDLATAFRVDHFIANSHFVANRIAKRYRREATVVHPPVEVDAFEPGSDTDDFYLMIGQLVSYKRTDLAVQAFNELSHRLVVIGDGAELATLRKMAKSNVELMGRQPFALIKEKLSRCKALIFPGIEDFGIVPVEAMAAGVPVIAYREGGAMETVVDRVTGIFFDEQTVEALKEAVQRFESGQVPFDREAIRQHAKTFDREVFKQHMKGLIDQWLLESRGDKA